MSAIRMRAMIPAANATPIASALIQTARGPRMVSTSGIRAATSVASSEGATGKAPDWEMGGGSSPSRPWPRALFSDMDRRTFRTHEHGAFLEEQRRIVARDTGKLDDFAEQRGERPEFGTFELRQRVEQALLSGLGRGGEERAPARRERKIDAPP